MKESKRERQGRWSPRINFLKSKKKKKILSLVLEHNFPKELILNLDQTPLSCVTSGQNTFDIKRSPNCSSKRYWRQISDYRHILYFNFKELSTNLSDLWWQNESMLTRTRHPCNIWHPLTSSSRKTIGKILKSQLACLTNYSSST